jgi:hypothetical protein
VNRARPAGAAHGATSRHASRAEGDDEVHPSGRHVGRAQPAEGADRFRGRHPRLDVELEEVVRVGAVREDPELRQP